MGRDVEPMKPTGNPKTSTTQDQVAKTLIDQATRREDSPFDFIIVGSGAGGGPLACRLALAGKKILLVEAGADPKVAGEVHDAPLFHGAATEHDDLSWQFSVRHYEQDARQMADHRVRPIARSREHAP